jgi:hypothetical protein
LRMLSRSPPVQYSRMSHRLLRVSYQSWNLIVCGHCSLCIICTSLTIYCKNIRVSRRSNAELNKKSAYLVHHRLIHALNRHILYLLFLPPFVDLGKLAFPNFFVYMVLFHSANYLSIPTVEISDNGANQVVKGHYAHEENMWKRFFLKKAHTGTTLYKHTAHGEGGREREKRMRKRQRDGEKERKRKR